MAKIDQRLTDLEKETGRPIDITQFYKLIYELAGDVYSGPSVSAPRGWVFQTYRDFKQAYERWEGERQQENRRTGAEINRVKL